MMRALVDKEGFQGLQAGEGQGGGVIPDGSDKPISTDRDRHRDLFTGLFHADMEHGNRKEEKTSGQRV
jgi:hypothetical protein